MYFIGTGELECGGRQLPIDPLNDNSDWVKFSILQSKWLTPNLTFFLRFLKACDRCPIRLDAGQVTFLVNQMGEEVDAVIYKDDIKVRELTTLIDKLRKFLHPNHFLLFSLKHRLIQLLGHQSGYMTSELSEMILLDKITVCQELLVVVKKLDPYGIRLSIFAGIIYHEMALCEVEMAQRRLKKATDPEQRIKDAKLLDVAEEHINCGLEALGAEQETLEETNLMKSLKSLNEQLQAVLNAAII